MSESNPLSGVTATFRVRLGLDGRGGMTDEVRYEPGGVNAVLRHVLCEVWTLQCYWCRDFKKYLELQIDHIVPQKGSPEERKRLEKAFQLNADYDVNAVANLAPI